MEYSFEIEYDGIYYEIVAEYIIERDGMDHAFGTLRLENAIPVNFLAYVNGARISPIDADLKRYIWRNADARSADALNQYYSNL